MTAISVTSILAVVAAVYFPSLSIGFLTDDFVLLAELQNRGIQWTSQWLMGEAYYRPIVSASLAANLALGGPHPFQFHLLNYILHISIVGILMLIVWTYLRTRAVIPIERILPMLAIGALFGLHPVQAVNVCWIPGRTDLLAGLFTSLMVLFYWRSTSNFVDRNKYVSFVCYAAALGAKEIALLTPLIIFAMDVATNTELKGRFVGALALSLLRLRGYMAVALLYVIVRVLWVTSVPLTIDWSSYAPLALSVLLVKSIVLMALPVDLLTLVTVWSHAPGLMVAAGIALVPTMWWFIRSMRVRPRNLAILMIPALVVGILLSLPLAASGIVSQRLMYVPLLGTLLALLPGLATTIRSHDGSRTSIRTQGPLLALLAAYLLLTYRNVDLWVGVSRFEQKAVDGLMAQRQDPSRPMAILTYPHRVLQASTMWSLQHRIHFARTGEFGREENVRVGFGIVGSSVEMIGHSVRWSPNKTDSLSFDVSTSAIDEYLLVDHTQIPPQNIDVVEFEGSHKVNALVRTELLENSPITRPWKYRATVIDTMFWRNCEIFLWNEGTFVRVR